MNTTTDRTNITESGYTYGGKDYQYETRLDVNSNPYRVDVLKGTPPAFNTSPNVSTTTVSNENKQNQVVGMQNQVNQLTQGRGQTTNGEVVQNADGSVVQDYQEPTLPPNSSPIYGTVNGQANRIIGYNQSDLTTGVQRPTYFDSNASTPAETPEERQFNDLISTMKASTDAQTARTISSIETKFKLLKDQQKQINEGQAGGVKNALLMGGITGQGSSAQYAPISSEGIMASQLTYGVQKLAELDSQEQDLINEAQQAGDAKKFQLLEKKLAQVDKKREEKAAEAKELNKKISEANEKAREKMIQSSRDSALADLYAQGITDPSELLGYLNGNGGDFTLKEINDGIKNLADANAIDTSKLSQDVQEYYSLKAQKDGLPVSILGLKSTAEQIAAYIKMKTTAETKKTGGTGVVGGVEVTRTSSDPFVNKILATKGGKAVTDTTIQKLDKGLTVLGQLGVLQANIQGEKTGPILGSFRAMNPWDTKGQTIKAQLNAVVPNLARGVYGEVGVLTDNDIKNYAKTIPNLSSTEDVRNAILYITLDMIGKSIKNTLETNAAAGRDVSGFVDIYEEMQANKNSILQTIPGANVPSSIKIGGSTATDFMNNPIPGTSAGKPYSPSVWSLFQ